MGEGMRLVDRLWLVPALFVLALIAWAMVVLPGVGADGTLWEAGGLIVEVDAGGTGERAGLRVGDVILSIGDCSMAMWDDCQHPIYRPGDVVPITFRRGGRVHETAITMQSMLGNQRLARLMVPLVALAFSLVSLVVLLSRPQAIETRLFYALCQIGAASLMAGVLSLSTVPLAARWFGTLTGLLTPVMVHFYAVFPERHWLGPPFPEPILM